MPTRGSGSEKRYSAVTPAMAAGLTDHIWSTSALLSYRVSVDFLNTIAQLQSLFPDWDQQEQPD
jgi:hypothetical protein